MSFFVGSGTAGTLKTLLIFGFVGIAGYRLGDPVEDHSHDNDGDTCLEARARSQSLNSAPHLATEPTGTHHRGDNGQ